MTPAVKNGVTKQKVSLSKIMALNIFRPNVMSLSSLLSLIQKNITPLISDHINLKVNLCSVRMILNSNLNTNLPKNLLMTLSQKIYSSVILFLITGTSLTIQLKISRINIGFLSLNLSLQDLFLSKVNGFTQVSWLNSSPLIDLNG